MFFCFKLSYPLFKPNKRPLGHIAHIRKQFKSINTYDYIIMLIKWRKINIINFMRIYWFFIWTNLNPIHPRMLWARLVEIGSVILEKRFFNFVNVFSLSLNYSPWKRTRAIHSIKLESPSPKDAFGQVWLKLALWFWRKRSFNFINIFSLFCNYLP